MSTVIKEFIYSGTLQIADVPIGVTSLTLHIWGGGGGSGGQDATGPGADGAAGHFVSKTDLDMTAYDGVKSIAVAVGGGGASGTSGQEAEGGNNGQSLTGYSGGVGGKSGSVGTSGSGGGGGGATTITLFESGQSINNIELAIAGGGAGSGGGGTASRGGAGINTNSATGNSPDSLGENGANHEGDGGGGGAGGGGADGGKGGSGATGDAGGHAGYSGSNVVPSGGSADDGSGKTPGGTGNAYYASGIAVGGAESQAGANGKAVLIFNIPAEAKHKVSGSWKNINEMYTKVSGTWKRLLGGYTKVSGTWKAFFGADILFQSNAAGFGNSDGGVTSGIVGTGGVPTILTIPATAPNIGGGPDPICPHPTRSVNPHMDSGEAGGNFSNAGQDSSDKIICTKLFELGYLPQEIYTADQKFGQWLRENDPYAYFGYVKWASVVVEWMDKEGPQCMFWIKDKKVRGEKQKALAISWAKRIATPWAQHMAYRMGTLPEDSKAGRIIMKFGLWLSRLIGKTTNTTTNTKSVKLGYSMWAIFGILYILAGIKGK